MFQTGTAERKKEEKIVGDGEERVSIASPAFIAEMLPKVPL